MIVSSTPQLSRAFLRRVLLQEVGFGLLRAMVFGVAAFCPAPFDRILVFLAIAGITCEVVVARALYRTSNAQLLLVVARDTIIDIRRRLVREGLSRPRVVDGLDDAP